MILSRQIRIGLCGSLAAFWIMTSYYLFFYLQIIDLHSQHQLDGATAPSGCPGCTNHPQLAKRDFMIPAMRGSMKKIQVKPKPVKHHADHHSS